jgi:hypothetical protein
MQRKYGKSVLRLNRIELIVARLKGSQAIQNDLLFSTSLFHAVTLDERIGFGGHGR